MVGGLEGGREVIESRSWICIYTPHKYYHRINFFSPKIVYSGLSEARKSKNREDRESSINTSILMVYPNSCLLMKNWDLQSLKIACNKYWNQRFSEKRKGRSRKKQGLWRRRNGRAGGHRWED